MELGVILFWLGVLAILAGVVYWVVAYQQSRKLELAQMSPELRAWHDSESSYRAAIKNAEKGHSATASAQAQNLRTAEKALATAKKMGTQTLSSIGVVRLAEDRVDIGGVVIPFSEGAVNTRVDVVLPSKSGNQQNPGSVTLWVSGSQGSASANLPYGKLKAIQETSKKIEAVSRDWPSVSKRAADSVAEATTNVTAARNQQQEVLDRSAGEVESIKNDRAAVEEARSHIQTAYCSRCGRNVAVVGDACPEGHEGLLEYRQDSLKPVRAVKRPMRGIRIAQAVLLVGIAFFVMGMALAPTPSSAPEAATQKERPAEERPAEEKPGARSIAKAFVLAAETGDDEVFGECFDAGAASDNAYEWLLSQAAVGYVESDTWVQLKGDIKVLLTPQAFGSFLSSDSLISVEETLSTLAYALYESDEGTVTLGLVRTDGEWQVVGIDAWELLLDDAFVADWTVTLKEGDAKHTAEIEAEKKAEAEREAAALAEEAARLAAEKAEEAARLAAEKAEAEITMGQRQAIGVAQDYLGYSAFSRKGLIDQLAFEGFSKADATFAVDYISPDWNAQAAQVAQDYLDFMSFSSKGLIDQLVFDGFTRAQAEYGVKAVGY